jgi:hypothetical protein
VALPEGRLADRLYAEQCAMFAGAAAAAPAGRQGAAA